MSDIHIYVRRIELSKQRRNSNFQSIYFVNKLGEIFSFIHCHVAWRICGLQGGSGEIQKRADQGQQLSLDLASKYYREDLWNSHKLCGLINLCTFHFESSASLDSYHRRPKRTMYDFGA